MTDYTVWNEDCVTGMRSHLESESVDLVFTDPPYGIKGDELDAHYHRDEGRVVPGYVEVPLETYAEFSRNWIAESARILRPGGSIYIVSGYTNLHHVLNALHGTDLEEVNHIIAQYSFGVSTTKKWVSSHYHVLFWQKPNRGKSKRTFNTNCFYSDQRDSYRDRLSVQNLPRDYKPGEAKNKNQLSERFIEKFILYSSNRGDIVCDPFGGSLSTGRASLRYGRRFVGFEQNANAVAQFEPTLKTVEVLDDPVPQDPSPEELAERERQRAGWRRKREQNKQKLDSRLFDEK